MRIGFRCPKCEQAYFLTPQIAGQTVQCHRCREIFQAPELADPAPTSPGQAANWLSPPVVPAPAPAAPDPWGSALEAALDGPVVPVARYRGRMTETDGVLLGLGVTVAVLVLICAALLLVLTGSLSAGVAILVTLLGLGGTGMAAFALRRRPLLAGAVGGGLGVLVLFSTVVSFQPAGPAGRRGDVAQAAIPAENAAGRASGSPATALEGSPATVLTTNPATAPEENPFAEAKEVAKETTAPEENPFAVATEATKATKATKASEESPFVRKTSSPETPATKAASEKSVSSAPTPAANLPGVVAAALGSTVLVEHPLASGSGFVVGENLVATNAHVVEGAYPEEITVKFGNENNPPQRIARVLYVDPKRDLCLLSGAHIDVPSLTVRSDYVLQAGDAVTLLGNPSVKGGILMRNVTNPGKMRNLMHIEGQEVYHIDADVNPGWSGGPVLDPEGRVIAVVVMKANDAAVKEIRQAMEKLDESFRTAHGSDSEGGITYGIPGSALAAVLADSSLRDPQRQAEINDPLRGADAAGTFAVPGRPWRCCASTSMCHCRCGGRPISMPREVRSGRKTASPASRSST